MTPSIGLSLPIRPLLSAGVLTVALVAGAGSAAAESKVYSYRVELAETAKKTQVRAGGVIWECRARYCIAAARGGNVSVKGCRELADQVGKVVSYRSEIKHLAKEQLEACNAVLAAAATPAGAAAAVAKQPEPPSRVTTEELTYTGVHQWNPAK